MEGRDDVSQPVVADFHDAATATIERRVGEVADLGASVLDLGQPSFAEAMVLATGRLRAALEFFRPVLEKTQYQGIRDEVRDLARVAQARRGLDASISLASAVGEEMDSEGRVGINLLIEQLDGERLEVNRQVALAVDERRLQALRVRLEDLLGGAERVTRGDGFVVLSELPDSARRVAARRLRRARKRIPEALETEDREALERALRAAARLRYALELAGPALGGQADTARRAARGLQEILIGVVDCDQTLPLVESEVGLLVERDAGTIRERGRGSRSLDPVLVQAAPNRDAYRGLMFLSVDLRARREIEFERFKRLWLEQARQGVWVALEASLTPR
jgi:CHAD domain-containing protein